MFIHFLLLCSVGKGDGRISYEQTTSITGKKKLTPQIIHVRQWVFRKTHKNHVPSMVPCKVHKRLIDVCLIVVEFNSFRKFSLYTTSNNMVRSVGKESNGNYSRALQKTSECYNTFKMVGKCTASIVVEEVDNDGSHMIKPHIITNIYPKNVSARDKRPSKTKSESFYEEGVHRKYKYREQQKTSPTHTNWW